jgi:hypothetical protein
MEHESLAIRIELRAGSPEPRGNVVLINTGGTPIRVWRTGNWWGDTVLSFEVSRGGSTRHVVRRPQEYTRNVPSSVEVPAGARHEWPFDLGDGQWEADAPLDQLLVPGAQLSAVYEVARTPEAVDHDVWIGRLRSQPVLLDE